MFRSAGKTRARRLAPLALSGALAGLSMSAVAQDAGVARVDLLEGQQAHSGFIVKYRVDAKAADDMGHATRQASAAAALTSRALGKRVSLARAGGTANRAHVFRANRVLDGVDAAVIMRQIALDPAVEYVEPNRLVTALAPPDDPRYTLQWHLTETTGGIRAPSGWDLANSGNRGAGVVIAVLDTGKTNHSDLNAKWLPGYDFITDTFWSKDGDGRDADPSDPGTNGFIGPNDPQCPNNFPCSELSLVNHPSTWHGTQVAGIAAAATNNANGIAGVGYNASILPVRVLGKRGVGELSDIADAIVWAAGGTVAGVPANPHPAQIINLSLGWQTDSTAPCSPTLQQAIDTAYALGATIIAAAGNSNEIARHEPARCDRVVSVAATSRNGARTGYSSYGASVDLSAPGGDAAGMIETTTNASQLGPGAEAYGGASGTSMAAPIVAGVAALIQAERKARCGSYASPLRVEDILVTTARAFPVPVEPGKTMGSGIVDLDSAVFRARTRKCN